jgi:hypothetical protein
VKPNKRYTRNAAADQVKAWKNAITDASKQQRRQRGRRRKTAATVGPGMTRRTPPTAPKETPM